MAEVLDTPLIRLQCYEGIDAGEALYEWNYPRSCWRSGCPKRGAARSGRRPRGDGGASRNGAPIARNDSHTGVPCWPSVAASAAAPRPRPAVLLVDEIDRADDEFEAFLLELLPSRR